MHLNKRFFYSLETAISFSAKFIIDNQEVAETIVRIRYAEQGEWDEFEKASEYFKEQLPEAWTP